MDDRRVLSGIIYVIRNGLMRRDAPGASGPHKTLYNRFVRWSREGVFNRIFAGLAGEGAPDQLMVYATHLEAHRTAASLRKKAAEQPKNTPVRSTGEKAQVPLQVPSRREIGLISRAYQLNGRPLVGRCLDALSVRIWVEAAGG